VAAIVALSLLATSHAVAQSQQDKAAAESLFQAARELAGDGNYDEACPKFAASMQLDPAVGTLLHLATCHEQQGKTASAWAEYREAVAMATQAGQKKRQQLATERADALEGKLSRIVIALDEGWQDGEEAASDLTVEIDGRKYSAATFGVPFPIDPGEHRLRVSAPDKQPYSERFEVPEGPHEQTLAIPLLDDASAASAPDPPPAGPDVVVPDPGVTEPDDPGATQRGIGYGVGAVGLAGIGVGSVFGLLAASQSSDADEHCEGQYCTVTGLAAHDDAETSALVSTIAFGVGAAALAAGLVVVLSAPSAPDEADSALWLHPLVGGLGMGGLF